MDNQPQQIPGLVFTAYRSDPLINEGAPIPCYEVAERIDGKPSINTLEGWNAAAQENAVHNYRKLLGKEPPSGAAAMRWQRELIEQEFKLKA